MRLLLFLITLIILWGCKENTVDELKTKDIFNSIGFNYTEISGIGFEQGITRRDPSDIIKVDSIYYIYYTKVIGQASGYWGNLWYATSVDDGYTWKEEGQILGIGTDDSFDSQAIFTPNIIVAKGKYYLFYTGVKPTSGRSDGVFENNSTTDITGIGLAIANAPHGPFERISTEPILKVSESREKFDSYRVDDAALLERDGKYFLYYKGRSRIHGKGGPSKTMMGLAISNNPEGPYIKQGDPIMDKSHEVLIWRQEEGVGALGSISSTLEFSRSGLDFMANKNSLAVKNRPNAPGAYRIDLTGGSAKKLSWGISMIHNAPDSYLVRFEASHKDSIFEEGTFGYDEIFLKKYYEKSLVLADKNGNSKLIISPELQARVMTSTLNGDMGISFGWLNYDLIRSKEIMEHINPTGGEERFWLGPEGGQYSIFFAPGSSFDFDNWFVPAALDTESFNLIQSDKTSAAFKKQMQLMNHSGTKFDLEVNRRINLLNISQISNALKIESGDFNAVAYQTENEIKNIGQNDWKKDSGLLSIWLLSMLKPTSKTTVVAPIKKGSIEEKGIPVNDNYFGKINSDRLKSTNETIYFRADGNSRGKIGISAMRSTGFIGSYDAKEEVLTILEINEPDPNDIYVNSAWEFQEKPYKGDVLNSYNDGAIGDAGQLGPFYELESSSPALALKSGESYTHTQRVYHFQGERKILDDIAIQVLKVSIDQIEGSFK